MLSHRLLGVLSFVLFSVAGSALPVTFTASLSGLNEVPVNPSAGTGFVTVTFDLAAHLLTVDATFSGLSSNTTASHIHAPGAPGVNAQVATQTPSFLGFPLGVTSGSFFNTLNTSLASTYNPAFVTSHGGTVAQAEADLYAALLGGEAYFNIHSTAFPGGEIRGNLASIPDSGATALLAIPVLLALAVGARHRRLIAR